jgi:hypothetical protein
MILVEIVTSVATENVGCELLALVRLDPTVVEIANKVTLLAIHIGKFRSIAH